jgi:hypothetical protein
MILARLLGPKQTTWAGTCNYTLEQLNEVKNDGYHLYIASRADYYDIFDEHHVTEYCEELVNLTGNFEDINTIPQADLTACGRNCADKECDKKE